MSVREKVAIGWRFRCCTIRFIGTDWPETVSWERAVLQTPVGDEGLFLGKFGKEFLREMSVYVQTCRDMSTALLTGNILEFNEKQCGTASFRGKPRN